MSEVDRNHRPDTYVIAFHVWEEIDVRPIPPGAEPEVEPPKVEYVEYLHPRLFEGLLDLVADIREEAINKHHRFAASKRVPERINAVLSMFGRLP